MSVSIEKYLAKESIFYLMILELLNGDSKKEESITLKELIKYFKKERAIEVVDFKISNKIFDLFDKYKQLFMDIETKNRLLIRREINKLILSYNRKSKINDRNFAKQFYEQLLLIACKNNMPADIISFIIKSCNNSTDNINDNTTEQHTNNYIQFKLKDDVALLVKEK